MRIPRIFQNQPLQEGHEIKLDREASHYVKQVLRMQEGQLLDVFNTQGGEYRSLIVKFHGKEVEVRLNTFSEGIAESPLKITLAQAISRGEKMDFTLQKAVELGVTSIVPLMTKRVGVKLDKERAESRLEHWQKVVISACEQSGRSFIPQVAEIQLLEKWLPTVNTDLKIILDPRATAHLDEKINPKEIVLMVGPEGGFSNEECDLAYAAGFTGWKLGERILRTETAGLAAISLLQAKWGDL